MPVKKEVIAQKTYFSQKKIRQITESLKARILEHMRKQSLGILPYASRLPVIVVNTYHILEILPGISASTLYRLRKKIRLKYGKEKGQYITVEEFCTTTGIPKEIVQRALDLLT